MKYLSSIKMSMLFIGLSMSVLLHAQTNELPRSTTEEQGVP